MKQKTEEKEILYLEIYKIWLELDSSSKQLYRLPQAVKEWVDKGLNG